jgi:hypothetical protein
VAGGVSVSVTRTVTESGGEEETSTISITGILRGLARIFVCGSRNKW